MHKLAWRRWRIGRALALHAEDLGSIPGRDKPKSLKQAIGVSEKHYKLMPRVTVCVAH